MWELEHALLQITGMQRATLQPSTSRGAGDPRRPRHGVATRPDTVVVPDSAPWHQPGVGHDGRLSGGGDIELVQIHRSGRSSRKLSERTAALMLTNPNTLGLYEEILTISRLVHEAGALCYYNEANLNAIMGRARPGDMGMDVVHINLHKTFANCARRGRAGRWR